MGIGWFIAEISGFQLKFMWSLSIMNIMNFNSSFIKTSDIVLKRKNVFVFLYIFNLIGPSAS